MKLAIHIGNVNVTIYKLGIKLAVHIGKYLQIGLPCIC